MCEALHIELRLPREAMAQLISLEKLALMHAPRRRVDVPSTKRIERREVGDHITFFKMA
jgi:hypothetical protein